MSGMTAGLALATTDSETANSPPREPGSGFRRRTRSSTQLPRPSASACKANEQGPMSDREHEYLSELLTI
eukprot:1292771-Rhodomonas_salina.6